MLYSRHDIVELVQQQPKELQSTLIALIWFASHGDANLVNDNRYGLLQLDTYQLRLHGFVPRTTGVPDWVKLQDDLELLNPATNIRIGAKLLERIGLVEFAGRNLAPQLPSIIALAAFLDSELNSTATSPSH